MVSEVRNFCHFLFNSLFLNKNSSEYIHENRKEIFTKLSQKYQNR